MAVVAITNQLFIKSAGAFAAEMNAAKMNEAMFAFPLEVAAGVGRCGREKLRPRESAAVVKLRSL